MGRDKGFTFSFEFEETFEYSSKWLVSNYTHMHMIYKCGYLYT